MQQQARHEQELLVEQLPTALASRIVIEQATGMLAELKLGTDQAFHLLRQHARSRNHRLNDLARAVIDGHADLPHRGPL